METKDNNSGEKKSISTEGVVFEVPEEYLVNNEVKDKKEKKISIDFLNKSIPKKEDKKDCERKIDIEFLNKSVSKKEDKKDSGRKIDVDFLNKSIPKKEISKDTGKKNESLFKPVYINSLSKDEKKETYKTNYKKNDRSVSVKEPLKKSVSTTNSNVNIGKKIITKLRRMNQNTVMLILMIGSAFIIILLIVVIVALLVGGDSEPKVETTSMKISKGKEIRCESSQGNISIYYENDRIVSYKSSDMTYDLLGQKEESEKVGMTKYYEDFSSWFEETTGGKCYIK